MRDVARLAGVSQSTVSRVLNDSPTSVLISEETQRKVREAVEQLGYYPNQTARSLRRQSAEMIAIMIADISNPFYHAVVRAAQDVARAHHYDVIIANTDHLVENEQLFVKSMIRRPVDGIIMAPYHLDETSIDQLIKRTGAKVVVLGSHIHHPEVDFAYANDEQAVIEATRWLIEQKGHSRIGYVYVPQTVPGMRRLNGFKTALATCGIAIDPALIVEGDWSYESGAAALNQLCSLDAPPTAIMFCNDIMAIGGLNAAHDRGIGVPQQLALVGFDNISITTLVRPRITTIGQYPADLGRLLATALFERLEGSYSGECREYLVGLELIERETT